MRLSDKLKIISYRIFFVITLILLSALLLEAGLRMYCSLFNPKVTKIDDFLGWKHLPSSFKDVTIEGNKFRITYNKKCLRGDDKPYHKDHSKFRVLFLGDSFTDASTVPNDKTFCTLIEKMDPQIETINMGCYGYGTVQEYLTFIDEGYKYEPDLVVLMTHENDFYDNLDGVYPWIGPRPKAIIDERGKLRISDIKDPLTKEVFMRDFLYVPRTQYFLLKNSFLYYTLDQYVYKKLAKIESKRLQNYLTIRYSEDQIELYITIVNKLYEEIKKRDADLIVFLFNSKETIRKLDNSPMKNVKDMLTGMGIHAIDLFPYIKEALLKEKEIYYKKDPHWNIDGYQFIARIILNNIESLRSYYLYALKFNIPESFKNK